SFTDVWSRSGRVALTRFSPSQERLHRREFPTTTRMRRKRTKRTKSVPTSRLSCANRMKISVASVIAGTCRPPTSVPMVPARSSDVRTEGCGSTTAPVGEPKLATSGDCRIVMARTKQRALQTCMGDKQVYITTTKQRSSMRQILAAIDHLHKQEFE